MTRDGRALVEVRFEPTLPVFRKAPNVCYSGRAGTVQRPFGFGAGIVAPSKDMVRASAKKRGFVEGHCP